MGMKKKLSRIILAIVILLILAVVVLILMIDSIAKSGVEKGTTYALGVQTTVDAVDVQLLNGRVIMDGLNIANPDGFVSTRLAHMGRFDVQVESGSLLSDTVHVRNFELDGVELHIEQKLSTSNITKILDKIKGTSKDEQASKAPSKKVMVDRIVLKNVVAHFHLLGSGPAIKIALPEPIELTNVTSENSGSVAGQLAGQIFPAILAAVIKQGQGLIPTDFLNGLDSQLQDVAKELGGQTIEQAGKAADQIKKTIGQTGLDQPVKDAGKTIEKGLGELGEGLFGSKKKTD